MCPHLKLFLPNKPHSESLYIVTPYDDSTINIFLVIIIIILGGMHTLRMAMLSAPCLYVILTLVSSVALEDGMSAGGIAYWIACWTNDREIGVPVSLATGGHVATVGQLLFAPWAGFTQPSILSGSVNE